MITDPPERRWRLGRLFHLERVDKKGQPVTPMGPQRLLSAVNQRLVERGTAPPWVATREECQAYWRSRAAGTGANQPSDYAAKPTEIVDFLHEFWTGHVGLDDTILELGCNAGANLNRLRELGYSSLGGVEINPHAIDELRRSFPALAESAEITVGSFEDVLQRRPSKSVDVVFSMAVLMHVHPHSHNLFRQMTRVARRALCVFETETANNTYVFARNYRRVFERLGCTELAVTAITAATNPTVSRAYDGYRARLFAVPTKP